MTLEFIKELENRAIIEGAYEDTKDSLDRLREVVKDYKRETTIDQSLRAVQKGRDAQGEGHEEDEEDYDVTTYIILEETDDGPELETGHLFDTDVWIQPCFKPVPVPYNLELSI